MSNPTRDIRKMVDSLAMFYGLRLTWKTFNAARFHWNSHPYHAAYFAAPGDENQRFPILNVAIVHEESFVWLNEDLVWREGLNAFLEARVPGWNSDRLAEFYDGLQDLLITEDYKTAQDVRMGEVWIRPGNRKILTSKLLRASGNKVVEFAQIFRGCMKEFLPGWSVSSDYPGKNKEAISIMNSQEDVIVLEISGDLSRLFTLDNHTVVPQEMLEELNDHATVLGIRFNFAPNSFSSLFECEWP